MTHGNPSKKDPRIFLGLSQPPLLSAAEWLVDTLTVENRLDLSTHHLILPSSRAVKRLMQLLVETTDQQKIQFIPPSIQTVGQLPELLYSVDQELATDLAQQIAWAKALTQTPQWELVDSLCAVVDNERDSPCWFEQNTMVGFPVVVPRWHWHSWPSRHESHVRHHWEFWRL